jgi:hypothetical protein
MEREGTVSRPSARPVGSDVSCGPKPAVGAQPARASGDLVGLQLGATAGDLLDWHAETGGELLVGEVRAGTKRRRGHQRPASVRLGIRVAVGIVERPVLRLARLRIHPHTPHTHLASTHRLSGR